MEDSAPCGLIFDLDGTLIESAPAIMEVGNAFLATLGLAPIDLAETRAFIGGGSEQFVRKMLEARGAADQASFASRFASFTDIYNRASPDANVAFPGVSQTLRALAASGHPLALCTNKPAAPARRVVEAMGWTELFPVVVAGDTLPLRKPDPAPLRKAAQDLACESFVFVGDSEVDAETAERAGVPFLLFTEGYRHVPPEELLHDASFSDYADLPGVVAKVVAALR